MAVRIGESSYGIVEFEGNELFIDSINADPPKVRLGCEIQPGCGGGGALSFDAMRPGTRVREELIMFHGEQAEHARANPTDYTGAFSGHFRDDRIANKDDAMIKGFEMEAYKLWLNPHWINCLRQQLGGAGSNLRSPQGRMSMELQEDGNLVVYRTDVTPWKAVWSIWTGPIP